MDASNVRREQEDALSLTKKGTIEDGTIAWIAGRSGTVVDGGGMGEGFRLREEGTEFPFLEGGEAPPIHECGSVEDGGNLCEKFREAA